MKLVMAFVAVVVAAWAPFASAQDVAKLVEGLNNSNADTRAEAWKSAGPAGAAAVSAIADLVASADPEVAKAAANALDQIVDHAGRPGAAAERAAVAAELAKLLDASRPEAVRRAGVRLLALGATDAEVPAIAGLLTDSALADDACLTLQQMASVPVAGVASSAAVQALASAAPGAPAPLKSRIVAALGVSSASPEVAVDALKSLSSTEDRDLRWAAVDALARQGVPPRTVFVSTKRWAPEDQERHFRACLIAADNLARVNSSTDRAYHLYAYVAKNSPFAYQVGAALPKCAYDDVIPIALDGLERPEISGAAIRVLSETKAETVESTLDRAYSKAGPGTKAAILEVLANRKSADLGSLLTEAGNDPSAEVRMAATELFGGAPAPELLEEVVRTGSPRGRNHAADLLLAKAVEVEGTDAATAARIYEDLVLTDLPKDVKVVAFGGLERTASPQVADFMARLRALHNPAASSDSDPKLVDEVKGYAPLTISAGKAYAASWATLEKDRAVPELQAIIDNVAEYDVIAVAVEKLATFGIDPRLLAAQRGFVTRWRVLGPFPNADWAAANHDFFAVSDGPIPDAVAHDAGTANAVEATTTGVPAVVNLRQYFQRIREGAAYGYAMVKSDKEQPVRILVGSDDGCQLWLNGQSILNAAVPRGMVVDGDKIDATLRPGDNHLIIKVLQGGGDWQFVVRLTDRDGKPLDLTNQP